MNNKEKIQFYSLISFAVGCIVGATVTYYHSALDSARIIPYGSKNIIATHQEMNQNQIYVTNPNASSNNLITLKMYLNSFTNENERISEQKRVEDLVK